MHEPNCSMSDFSTSLLTKCLDYIRKPTVRGRTTETSRTPSELLQRNEQSSWGRCVFRWSCDDVTSTGAGLHRLLWDARCSCETRLPSSVDHMFTAVRPHKMCIAMSDIAVHDLSAWFSKGEKIIFDLSLKCVFSIKKKWLKNIKNDYFSGFALKKLLHSPKKQENKNVFSQKHWNSF